MTRRLRTAPPDRRVTDTIVNFFSGGKCLKCAERCPAGAITEMGHDKGRCRQYIREVAAPYTKQRFGLTVDNCGLCQSGVPCASRIPAALHRKSPQHDTELTDIVDIVFPDGYHG